MMATGDWADRIQWSGVPKRPWGCKRGWLPSVVVEGDGRVTAAGGLVTCYWPTQPIQTPLGLEWLELASSCPESGSLAERRPDD